MATDLEKASDPNLSPQEFKALLDKEDLEIYLALSSNDVAGDRYVATLPMVIDEELEKFSDNALLEYANAEHDAAQFEMGMRAYQKGDIQNSRFWLHKSAQNGNMIAAFNYALSGSDPEEMLYWFKKAAFRGVPNAQRELGLYYGQNGDLITARKWLDLACQRGLIEAFNDLGVVNWQEGNYEEAVRLWTFAASEGNQEASDNLAMASTQSLFDDDELDYFDDEFDTNNGVTPAQNYGNQGAQATRPTQQTVQQSATKPAASID